MGTPNQPVKTGTTGANKPPVKPTTQPVKQTEKPVTNDTTTSKNSVNAELSSNTNIGANTGAQPNSTSKDSDSQKILVEEANLGKTLANLFDTNKASQDDVDEDFNKASLQNEKSLKAEDAKPHLDEIKPAMQIPTTGRVVVFHFAPEDGICSNNQVEVLPAFVVKAGDLTPSLSVFTLDSRDPVVLRKDIPYVSIAPKDSEDNPIKPYWDWPVIVR